MKPDFKVLNRKLKRNLFRPFYLIIAILVLCSHDLYLKMDGYFLAPNEEATLSLYNGTFEKSENTITRDRIQDASVVAQGERIVIQPEQWKDQDSTITQFTFTAGEAGTYVAGVSTKARNIELAAEDFNDYLKHDGVLDMLEQRTNENVLDQDAVESYEKHVKAIYQVGDTKTSDWSTVLGYPIEFVPQSNPYESYSGETLEVALLLDGEPLANQLVYANYLKNTDGHTHEDDGSSHSHEPADGTDVQPHTHDNSEEPHTHDSSEQPHTHDDGELTHTHDDSGNTHTHDNNEHTHSHDNSEHTHTHDNNEHTHTQDDAEQPDADNAQTEEEHTHTSGQQLRTNELGIVSVDLPEDGIYYLRTIHMVNVTDSDALTHRSKWATLSFEVSHQHGEDTHTHDDHEEDESIPIWAFVLGSMLIVGILFLVFRKSNS